MDTLGMMQQLGVIPCTRSTADMIKLGLVRIPASLVVADPGLVLTSPLCVPKTSSRSCEQAIFVDQATDASLPPEAVLLKVDRFE